jgi:hypothetical protein
MILISGTQIGYNIFPDSCDQHNAENDLKKVQ